MSRRITVFHRKSSIFKYEMSLRIAQKMVIFQIGNRFSARMVHFQIRNEPQDHGFSTKIVDFQIRNERLKTCEHLFKIDHRKFQIVQISELRVNKKLSKRSRLLGHTGTHGRTHGHLTFLYTPPDFKPPRFARGKILSFERCRSV